MTFEQELEHVKREHPKVYNWLLGVDDLKVSLPIFDDDDEPHYDDKYLTKEEIQNDKRHRCKRKQRKS